MVELKVKKKTLTDAQPDLVAKCVQAISKDGITAVHLVYDLSSALRLMVWDVVHLPSIN